MKKEDLLELEKKISHNEKMVSKNAEKIDKIFKKLEENANKIQKNSFALEIVQDINKGKKISVIFNVIQFVIIIVLGLVILLHHIW